MLCERIDTPKPSENLADFLDPLQREKLHAAMVVSGGVLKTLRRRKLHRDWMAFHPERHREYKEQERRHLNKIKDEQMTINSPMRSVLRRVVLALRKLRAQTRVRNWVGRHKDRVPGYGQTYYRARYARIRKARSTPEAKRKKLILDREYLRKARRENIQIFLATRLRARMSNAFRERGIKKNSLSKQLVGCTFAEAKAHIESQFVNGMCWENRRSFVIDHLVPVAAFDLRDTEEAHWAFNWRNLRPITQHDNAVKSDTLPSPLPDWLPPHIAARIVSRSTPPAHPPSAPS